MNPGISFISIPKNNKGSSYKIRLNCANPCCGKKFTVTHKLQKRCPSCRETKKD